MGANENAITRTPWIQTLHDYVKPYWDHLLNGPWAEGIAQGKLTLSEMQGWMLQIYPFIHVFPKYLAETLIKVQDDYSRNYYINNIRVEKAHADHWVWMGIMDVTAIKSLCTIGHECCTDFAVGRFRCRRPPDRARVA